MEHLYRYCPKCEDQVEVDLRISLATVVTPLLVDRDPATVNDLITDREHTDWFSEDDTTYACCCSECGYVFSKGYPETIKDFEKFCREYEPKK